MSTNECDKYWHLQSSRPPPQHCGQLLAEPQHHNSRNRVHSSHAQYAHALYRRGYSDPRDS